MQPTPPADQSQGPNQGELLVYETGVNRFFNLARLGSFRTWDFRVLFPETAPGSARYEGPFNCFAWSLGFTDRWIEGGNVEQMERLYTAYLYQKSDQAAAEIELYRILDAPAELPIMFRGQQTGIRLNPRARVLHAHRRDYPALDEAPSLGCSSKLGNGSLIAHNRGALADDRGHAAGRPQVNYGSIYQTWQRSSDHPSWPGQEGTTVPAKGHRPDDKIFERGTGAYPPGHPGNDIGLPGGPSGTQAPTQQKGRQGDARSSISGKVTDSSRRSTSNTTPLTSNIPVPGSAASPRSGKDGQHRLGSRDPTATPRLSSRDAPPHGGPQRSDGSDSESGSMLSLPSFSSRFGHYQQLSKMDPYDLIPAASPAAADSAERLYSDIKGEFPGLVTDFNNKWMAWTKTWFPNEKSGENPHNAAVSPLSSSASDRCLVPEFDELTALGPKIIPLVVYKLASEPQSFIGIQLYNELEKDMNYMVDPADVINSMVLQRQANLIVDMNYDRNKLAQARIEAWKAHCTRSHIHSTSAMYTECEEYDKLLELDGSIIAHLMLAYGRDQTGFWWELLHEIVHGFGKKTGLWTIDFKQQYAEWSKWFKGMKHSEAPRWIQGKRVR